MKKQFFGVAITCCLLVLTIATSARSQLPGSTEHATIPFDFIVRGKTLPAGEYTIRRIGESPEGLMIADRSNRDHAMFVTEPVEALRIPNKGRLVFHRYGDSYFLYEVWTGGESTGRELAPSRAERQLRSESASNNKMAQEETVAIQLD
jgi:hypothetical protein